MSARVLTVVGARPQFIKAAPVSRALKEAGVHEVMLHTGQHFDELMSEVFFRELGLDKPAYNLEIGGLAPGAMAGRMLEKISTVLADEKPAMVLVYGDTTSTLAGALAATQLHIPVAHVEAGLRSFNRAMPEETNRVLADHVSSLLFCPTRTAVENLAREGIMEGVHAVGDVMFDATLSATQRSAQSRILETCKLKPKTYAVATIHRAENTDDAARFGKIAAWLGEAEKTMPIVMPVHPRTKKIIGQALSNLQLIEPLGYLDMAWLMHNAAAVYTDSGGLQKEAYFHRVPCVTLRDETEWVETVEAGWNRLWTIADYKPRREITDYGTGDAAQKIAALIAETLAQVPKRRAPASISA